MAAIRAAQLGAQVTLIEEQEVGGTCLNKGCIPSKALIFNTEVFGLLGKADRFGIRAGFEPGLDLPRVLERKNRVVQLQVRGVRSLLKSWGVRLINGRGRLSGPGQVEVSTRGGETKRHEADRIILATGSKPLKPPAFPFDGTRVITSEEALEPRDIPARLLIIGAGVEGCEFGFLYRGLGSEVTLVEMQPRPLSAEDEEVSSLILREMKKKKIGIHLNTRVEKVEIKEGRIAVTLSGGQTETVDRVLVSVGRSMNTAGIGLEEAGVERGERGEIRVNENLETTVPGIFGIGDALGRVMLAHVASAEGKVAAANAVGGKVSRVMDYRVIPAGIFTTPEIGTVG
ncbi:MAG TPA: NAD(P)/FAD-dependent oxidoreductase, partial [Nitrospiria bacterium]|nr:NAD(P)/FAD-dependent oxidoreductase [Nitrospiria bacterium]